MVNLAWQHIATEVMAIANRTTSRVASQATWNKHAPCALHDLLGREADSDGGGRLALNHATLRAHTVQAAAVHLFA